MSRVPDRYSAESWPGRSYQELDFPQRELAEERSLPVDQTIQNGILGRKYDFRILFVIPGETRRFLLFPLSFNTLFFKRQFYAALADLNSR